MLEAVDIVSSTFPEDHVEAPHPSYIVVTTTVE
jgi:hypothetical protein